MLDPQEIAALLQRRLDESGPDEVTAVEAAVWLDDAGLLKDSRTRPGLPLRELLRAGKISHAEQRSPCPNGKVVYRASGIPECGAPGSTIEEGAASR